MINVDHATFFFFFFLYTPDIFRTRKMNLSQLKFTFYDLVNIIPDVGLTVTINTYRLVMASK